MADDYTVADSAPQHRYEIRDADGELAGFAHYERVTEGDREVTVLDRTVVFPDFQGQGIGGRLARAALADVRGRGGLVEPACPFIEGWIDKHPDQQDLLVRPA
ncbi:GNAT family N-acetyltransferase [Actinomyces polynesiensis]|uniref:GNAT family N-acetyltransferase n=1 Tax=Actinomyces polynesiensis TaxID=1325934 RepID=UPI0005BD713B|nr:GNAT family N-acetyltransferase [Actinomyces polynesiensis]